MNNKMFFFVEKTPGIFVDKTLRIKSKWNCAEEYKDVNDFCYNIRDRLNGLFQNTMGMKRSQNMSNQEKAALRNLHLNKNVNVIINDTDKNVGPACAEKTDVIKECRRQLYDKEAYNILTQEEAEQLIRVIKQRLSNIVNKHTIRGNCSNKGSGISTFKFEQIQNSSFFYIIWKILKNPIVDRPIVAGYKWILTPASIFVGYYLKDFCNKFDTILRDSFSLVKHLEKEQFTSDCFLFSVDLKSLYTNIPAQKN